MNTQLEWPTLAEDGALLFDTGTVVPDEPSRMFLFQQFELYRAAEPAPDTAQKEEAGESPPKLEEIGLAIGSRVGLRGTGTTGSSMYASRVIGFSNPRRNNERSLFITQPLMTGFGALDLARGEQVELVALTGRGVFRFTCTVDATSCEPFNYVVLSAPGAIRRLRARKFARMPTRLAARYAAADEVIGEGHEVVWHLARVSDISPYGMSLTVRAPTAKSGARLRLAFHFNTDGVDVQVVQVDIHAIVRHVGEPDPATDSVAYGLEFDDLEPSQRIALKSFMAEHSWRFASMTRCSACQEAVRKEPFDCRFEVLDARSAAQRDGRRLLSRRGIARQHREWHTAHAQLRRELFVFNDEIGVRAVVERLFEQFGIDAARCSDVDAFLEIRLENRAMHDVKAARFARVHRGFERLAAARRDRRHAHGQAALGGERQH
ncbi:hypothetical protein BHUM_02261c [Candidatus Burkholderia humilis]|nr:hypothetical protein BHUM_02261c [Candidatus Burkholderia humilis]